MVALGLAGTGSAAAANFRSISVGPTPAWVELMRPEPPSPGNAEAREGVDWLLDDIQYDVATEEDYCHYCYRITDNAGLQSLSQASVDYDPTYQTVTLHLLRVLRNGVTLDRLTLDRFKVIQQEKDLDRFEYNGRLTALALLDDIRVGDEVEFAYTVHGRNPIFHGRFEADPVVRWNAPIERERVRVLVPASRPLAFRPIAGAVLQETMREHDGIRDYEWTASHLTPIDLDPDLPTWWEPYPMLEVSEYAHWSDVVGWALPLYALPDHPSPGVAAQAQALIAGKRTAGEQMASILDFVQNDIRYLGIEMGTGSHRPSPPEQVLRQRFGDCKDKTRLLCALLRAAGFPTAVPALTHTWRGRTIAEWSPSVEVFNHVIARVIWQGRTLWLDSTISDQGGAIDGRYIPEYEWALPIARGIGALQSVTCPTAAIPTTTTTESFKVNDVNQPVPLEMTTLYTGGQADEVRSLLRHRARDEVERDYLNYRATVYGQLRTRAPFEWVDDRESNHLVVKGHYLIGEFFRRTNDQAKRAAYVYPVGMRDYMRAPASINRTTALGVRHPVNFDYKADVTLPKGWPVTSSQLEIRDAAFRGYSRIAKTGDQAIIEWGLHTLRDYVPASEIDSYSEDLRRLRDAVGFELTIAGAIPDTTSRFRLSALTLGTALLGVLAGLAVAGLARARPRRPDVAALGVRPRLSGFGGWLIVLALAVVVVALALPVETIMLTGKFVDARVWDRLSRIRGGSLLSHLVVGEIFCSWAFVAISIAATAAFFRRDRRFPLIYATLLAGLTVYHFCDWLALPAEYKLRSGPELWLAPLASAILWISYLAMSRRVAATFVAPGPVRSFKPNWAPKAVGGTVILRFFRCFTVLGCRPAVLIEVQASGASAEQRAAFSTWLRHARTGEVGLWLRANHHTWRPHPGSAEWIALLAAQADSPLSRDAMRERIGRPANVSELVEAAEFFMARTDWRRADEALRSAWSAQPRDPRVLRDRIMLAVARDRPPKEIDGLCREAQAVDPSDRYSGRLRMLLALVTDGPAAEDDALRYLGQFPDDLDVSFALAAHRRRAAAANARWVRIGRPSVGIACAVLVIVASLSAAAFKRRRQIAERGAVQVQAPASVPSLDQELPQPRAVPVAPVTSFSTTQISYYETDQAIALLARAGNAQEVMPARNMFADAAERGDARAMCYLGLLYAEGLGSIRDLASADTWLRASAERGYAPAMYFLARNIRRRISEGNTSFMDTAEQADFWMARSRVAWTGSSSPFRSQLPAERADHVKAAAQRSPDAARETPATGGGTRAARPIVTTPPVYPANYLFLRLHGTVIVDFLVDKSGKVENVRGLSASFPGFFGPAVGAVMHWQFAPALSKGRPVPYHLQVPIVFQIHRKGPDAQ